MPRVSLFIPMHNERASFGPTSAKALEVLSSLGCEFELLIVDDGSDDGSERAADALAAADPRVRVVHHAGRRGYGQALRTGFAEARGAIVAYTDCDEPADLRRLPEALRLFEDPAVDLVAGYRLGRYEGPRRYLLSAGYNALLRLLFRLRLRDVNFSFKLIRRQALLSLRLRAVSGFIDGELMIEATRRGLRIVELPVIYQRRLHGASHFDSLRAVTGTLAELWRYRRTGRPGRD